MQSFCKVLFGYRVKDVDAEIFRLENMIHTLQSKIDELQKENRYLAFHNDDLKIQVEVQSEILRSRGKCVMESPSSTEKR